MELIFAQSLCVQNESRLLRFQEVKHLMISDVITKNNSNGYWIDSYYNYNRLKFFDTGKFFLISAKVL